MSSVRDLAPQTKKAAALAGNQPRRFALIGAAGFVAPRHMQAIRDSGNVLVAAVDPHDCVGVLDSYFPEARFFTEIERFDRFLEKQRRDSPVEYVTVCSPNYLHDAHVRLGLRVKAQVLCEKPLVINPWNLDQLAELEQEHQRRVFTVLQLRLHPAIQALKQQLASNPSGAKHEICLTYITRRGAWYHTSWKGSEEKSGGLVMNIGIHFFDVLLWLFGAVQRSHVHLATPKKLSGYLELDQARVRWFLSVDAEDLPAAVRERGGHAFRSLTIDEREIDLSEGFTSLHTEVYRQMLAGHGFTLAEARPGIELAYAIRHSVAVKAGAVVHPFVKAAAT